MLLMLRYFTITHVMFINKKLTPSECMVLLLLNFHILAFFKGILISFFKEKNTISMLICSVCVMMAVKVVTLSPHKFLNA